MVLAPLLVRMLAPHLLETIFPLALWSFLSGQYYKLKPYGCLHFEPKQTEARLRCQCSPIRVKEQTVKSSRGQPSCPLLYNEGGSYAPSACAYMRTPICSASLPEQKRWNDIKIMLLLSRGS
jgi:hypothetical protein